VYSEILNDGWVRSARNDARISLKEFRPYYISKERDTAMLRGPPNWEGLLATKGVEVVPITQLAKSKCTLYSYEGKWIATNGELVGTTGKFVNTLCNTSPGDSGTPLFSGKRVLGVHVGGAKEGNYNCMAPIPSIAGLTTPNYVFETTAPTGRIFTNSEVVEFMAPIKKAFNKIEKDWTPISGVYWADVVESESGVLPEAQPRPATPQDSGNEESGTDRSSTGKESTRKLSRENGEEMMERIVSALVAKINTATIEEKVAKMLTEKMSRPTKGRGRPKPKNSVNSLPANTHGDTIKDKPKSPVSNKSEPILDTTIPPKRKTQNGVRMSPADTYSWRRKRKDSAGPSSAPPPS